MKRLFSILSAVLLLSATLTARAAGDRTPSSTSPPIISWQPPATYSMTSAGGRTSLAEIGSGPATLFPITPCRQYDSRNSSPLLDNTARTVTLTGAPCGIPTSTNAIAVNITVFNIVATASAVFKVGTSAPPTTAWINYPPSETQRANAGIVATNGNAIVVQVNQGSGSVDFTVDVFGYYYNGNSYQMPASKYFSIWGNYSGGGVLFGRNDQAAAAGSFGVRGFAFSTGAASAGVEGESLAATGAVRGVAGLADSTTAGAAGVAGRVGTATFTDSTFVSGVLGVADGGTFPTGLLGLGTYRGATGWRVSAAGALQTYGILGASGTDGLYTGNDLTALGTKSFVEPDTTAGRVVKYVALEGPEAGTYFRGRGRFVGRTAVIEVPDDFRVVTDQEGITVQITPIGRATAVGVVYIGLDRIEVESMRDVEFSYLVQGVRRSYRDWKPIQNDNVNYYVPNSAAERMPEFLAPEVRQRLVANGTYNPDGTVNMTTAERMGWAQKWREDEARLKAAQEAATAKAKADQATISN